MNEETKEWKHEPLSKIRSKVKRTFLRLETEEAVPFGPV